MNNVQLFYIEDVMHDVMLTTWRTILPHFIGILCDFQQ